MTVGQPSQFGAEMESILGRLVLTERQNARYEEVNGFKEGWRNGGFAALMRKVPTDESHGCDRLA